MPENHHIEEIIRNRSSVRTYEKRPLDERARLSLEEFCGEPQTGPFGASVRLKLAAAREEDAAALKGLGTYGFIKNPAGFIIGAVGDGERNLEDFGYVMEEALLRAAALGLGSCWLGGSFTKSAFSARIGAGLGETVPAVISVGHPAEKRGAVDRAIRWSAGSKNRRPPEELFFTDHGRAPLPPGFAGGLAVALEMVRLAPSASNRQPWRLVVDGEEAHLFLERTKGYHERNKRLLNMADLQRVDMGIAACHFEKAARTRGLHGGWRVDVAPPAPEGWEYIASWKKKR
ncbi:MAG TPA: nitroreductase [Spirochaetes bacterium]|nr:nitroreductase [Spirochaetota bacterium]